MITVLEFSFTTICTYYGYW